MQCDFHRAHIGYRATGQTDEIQMELLESLSSLSQWQIDLRAKRYKVALKHLEQIDSDTRSILEPWVDIQSLMGNTQFLSEFKTEHITDPQELEEQLASCLDHPATRPEALNHLGVLNALLGNIDTARTLFEEILNIDPKHHRARTNLGNLFLEEGDFATAEQHYRAALALQPDYATAHNNLSAALKKQKKIGAAVKALKKSHRLEQRRIQAETQESKSITRWFSSRWVQYILIAIVVFFVWNGLHKP